MCAGWADSTHKQYNSYFKKWHNFCEERNCNSIESDLKTIIDFLTYLHYQGYSYSGIITAKFALMSLVTVNNSSSWSLDPDLNRFIKGIYNIKPPLPKYSSTWDVDIVLRFLSNWMPLSDLTLKELTLKAVTLVALVSGNRAQSIHQMKLNLFHETQNQMSFYFDCKLKTSNPNKKAQKLILNSFEDSALCVFHTLQEYLRVTKDLRKDHHFWISWKKPHDSVGRQTISRWLKQTLQLSGINTSEFGGHSTRMAATSKAHAMGVGLSTILNTAGWASQHNFVKFYCREKLNNDQDFAKAVLDISK